MGTYEDYPFFSAKGQQIMLDIFNGIYQTDPNDATTIQDTDEKQMVSHYMKNKVGIVYNIRKFLSSYSPVTPDNSYDSGIYICDPSMGGCGRRDFIYNWEFVDFGVYGNMKTWRGNVDLLRNTMNGQSGFLVMTRVRCNSYVVCKDCGEQWATQNSGAGVCIYCNSSNVEKRGCGKESYSKHFVKEQNVSNLQAESQNMVESQKYVWQILSKGKTAKLDNGKPFAYRLTYSSPAYDRQINSFEEACEYIPNLEVGYQIGAYKRPYGFTCDTCDHERFFPPPSTSYPFGRPMSQNDVDTNWSSNPNQPQTGGIYMGIGKNGTNRCTEAGCSGNYLPNMGWVIGHPKVLGPTREYKPEYVADMFQQQIARAANATPSRYPISAMRHAFTEDPKIICTAHQSSRGEAGMPVLWADNAQSRCMVCGNQRDYDMSGQQCAGMSANNWQCGIGGTAKGANMGNKWDVLPPGRKTDYCKDCTTSDPANFKQFKGVGGRPFLFPRKKLVISAKKDGGFLTTKDVTGRPIRNKPVWAIYLDSKDSDDYRFGLSLAGIHTSAIVPTSLDQIRTQDPGGGSSLGITCKYDPIMMPDGSTQNKTNTPTTPPPQGCCQLPNGTAMMSTEDVCIASKGTYMGDGVTCLEAKIQAGATQTGPCSGVTWSGLTFMIAEGRAQHAFKNSKNRWVDESVPCRSYRDPANPNTPLNAPVTYPRFIFGPNYDPRTQTTPPTLDAARRYEWCDDRTHVICDPFHTGSLSTVTSNTGGQIGITLHDITSLGHIDDPSEGRLAYIKCKTCEKIYKRGKSIASRHAPDKKKLTPYPSSDWTLIGGGKDLQDAYDRGVYYPGMAVLMFRKGKGQIRIKDSSALKDIPTAVSNYLATMQKIIDNAPDEKTQAQQLKAHRDNFPIQTPKPRQYSLEAFKDELAIEQTGQSGLIPGFWNWMHVPADKEGSRKMNEAKGNVVIL